MDSRMQAGPCAPLFGQTVVVNKRSVVAVEAMEGTDATLLRADLCVGGTVVKMMRLDQDERWGHPDREAPTR